MEPTYEKIDDATIKVTTPQPPTEETVSISDITDEKTRLQQEISGLADYYAAEVKYRNDRIAEIDALFAQAQAVGVVA